MWNFYGLHIALLKQPIQYTMNKIQFFTWGIVVLAGLLAACEKEGGYGEAAYQTEAADAPGNAYLAEYEDPADGAAMAPTSTNQALSPAEPGNSATPTVERKLIKNGNLQWEAKGKDSVRRAILALLPKYQGYTTRDEDQTHYNQVQTTLEIRVPADRFDALVEEISSGVRAFDHRNISVRDVSEEFVDLEARRKSKRELEVRYLELLKKANTVEDMLQVEGKLNQVRTEIERMEGRLRYLTNQVSLSTLTINIYEYIDTPEVNDDPSEITKALQDGWDILTTLLLFFLRIWPFTLIGLVLIVWYFLRRKKNRE